ncbi:MAG: hypothetical protein EZS28_038004, partial [Streblomastix strix]
IHLICIVVASFTIPSLLGEMKEGMESSNGQINTVINQIKNISDVIDKVPLLITDFQELIDSYHMGTVIDAMVSDNSAINRLRTNLILATENLAVVANRTHDSFMVGQDTEITDQIDGLSQYRCNLTAYSLSSSNPYQSINYGWYNTLDCLDNFLEMLQREKISKDIDITKAMNAITAASKQGEKEVKVASKQLFDVISNFSTEVIQLGEDTIKQLIDSSNGIFNALGDHPIGDDQIKSLEDTTKAGREALQIVYNQIEETKLKYKCSGVLEGMSSGTPQYAKRQQIDDLLADFNKKYTTKDLACSELKTKMPSNNQLDWLEKPAASLAFNYSLEKDILIFAADQAKGNPPDNPGPAQQLSDAASAQSNALKAVDIEKMKVNVQTAKDQIAQVNKTLDDAKKPVEETSEQVRTYLGKVNDPLVSIIKQYDDVVVVAKQWVSLASNLLGGFFLFVILLLVLQ